MRAKSSLKGTSDTYINALPIAYPARNIYYQDPELFKTQAVVDRDVDLLAYTFGLRRADLHVVRLPFCHRYASPITDYGLRPLQPRACLPDQSP